MAPPRILEATDNAQAAELCGLHIMVRTLKQFDGAAPLASHERICV
jgi:hypothetical protein